jgi:hypothetical protein
MESLSNKIKSFKDKSNYSYSFGLIQNKRKFILSLTNSSKNIEISNDSNSKDKNYKSVFIEELDHEENQSEINQIISNKKKEIENNFDNNTYKNKIQDGSYKYQII